MSEIISKCYSYTFECDRCGIVAKMHTGDRSKNGNLVHNSLTARNACGFHQSKGMSLCDNCFRQTRKGIRTPKIKIQEER